jgi:hypothetical protein
MSKKSRRSRAKVRATQQVVGSEVVKHSEAAAVEVATAMKVESKVIKPMTHASAAAQGTRYQYIVPELQRIGIIAGVLFAIIIVLGFVIK